LNFRKKNHKDSEYNCPDVAFYPEVIKVNQDSIIKTKFLAPYITLNIKKHFVVTMYPMLSKYIQVVKADIEKAY